MKGKWRFWEGKWSQPWQHCLQLIEELPQLSYKHVVFEAHAAPTFKTQCVYGILSGYRDVLAVTWVQVPAVPRQKGACYALGHELLTVSDIRGVIFFGHFFWVAPLMYTFFSTAVLKFVLLYCHTFSPLYHFLFLPYYYLSYYFLCIALFTFRI